MHGTHFGGFHSTGKAGTGPVVSSVTCGVSLGRIESSLPHPGRPSLVPALRGP